MRSQHEALDCPNKKSSQAHAIQAWAFTDVSSCSVELSRFHVEATKANALYLYVFNVLLFCFTP